jgi:hydroxybutyrate-dimer hydrolase
MRNYLIILTILTLQGCGGSGNALTDAGNAFKYENNTSTTTTTTTTPTLPITPVSASTVSKTVYNGADNDLLTGGLGETGLLGAAPTLNSTSPTGDALRKSALYYSYKNQIDMRSASGFGTFYGPSVTNRPNGGKIAGTEYLAYSNDGLNTTLLLQIPTNFDPTLPCLIAAPSTGSQGVFGAVSTAGEWGLKNRCAVIYTDKGTGIGVHDLTGDTVTMIDGTRTTSSNAGSYSNFTATGKDSMSISSFASSNSNRIAQKHAHSQRNPEKDWGKNVLNSITFAFDVLNRQDVFGNQNSFNAENVMVIATGFGEAGTAALKAAEQDGDNLIDAVVAVAPLISVRNPSGFTIKQGTQTWDSSVFNKTLLETFTHYNLVQPCVSGDSTYCSNLKSAGVLSSTTSDKQITEALHQLFTSNGSTQGSHILTPIYQKAGFYAGYAYNYASAYGKLSVVENLCNYGYQKNGNVITLFANGSGTTPSDNVSLINSTSYQSASCLRQLVTKANTLLGADKDLADRIYSGMTDTLATGDLRNKPALILHGRDDPLALVNQTSRVYYGMNKKFLSNSKLAYLEIKNAHHFDNLNQQYGLNYVPLTYYMNNALDAMLVHLQKRTALPQSMVVAAKPAPSGTALDETNYLVPFSSTKNCAIIFSNSQLVIPDC